VNSWRLDGVFSFKCLKRETSTIVVHDEQTSGQPLSCIDRRAGHPLGTFADGTQSVFGEPEAGFPDVALTFTDKAVPRDILLDQGLGAAEAYMDGRPKWRSHRRCEH